MKKDERAGWGQRQGREGAAPNGGPKPLPYGSPPWALLIPPGLGGGSGQASLERRLQRTELDLRPGDGGCRSLARLSLRGAESGQPPGPM